LNHEQLGLSLFPDLPPEPRPTVTVKKRIARVAKTSVADCAVALATGAASDDVEQMAQTLERHPDYRVQRRLKPCLLWPGAAAQAVTRVVVLDTETTGLDQSKERIIELALLRVDIDTATGLPVGAVQVYDGLEDPGKPIPQEVVAITGITDADVRGQRIDEARVLQLLQDVDVVIAHNAGFDRPFAEARLSRFAELTWACSLSDIDWKTQGRSSAKLENLAQALGLFYDAHRAEMDCHALLAVLAAPLPRGGGTALAQLLSAATKPSYRLSATGAPFDAKDLLKARGYRWNAEQRVWQARVGDDAALQVEFDWLKEHAYQRSAAVVQFEKLNALVRFSGRGGEFLYHTL
jgi:DNA polymerase-3 subunit epsilon